MSSAFATFDERYEALGSGEDGPASKRVVAAYGF